MGLTRGVGYPKNSSLDGGTHTRLHIEDDYILSMIITNKIISRFQENLDS